MNPTVLIVEDDAGIAGLLSEGFRQAGCETVQVPSGEKALDVVSKIPVQLVTLDIGLAGQKSGFDVLKELRTSGCKIPVVMIAGDVTLGLCRRVWPDDGYTQWYQKPVSLDEIHAMVKGALS